MVMLNEQFHDFLLKKVLEKTFLKKLGGFRKKAQKFSTVIRSLKICMKCGNLGNKGKSFTFINKIGRTNTGFYCKSHTYLFRKNFEACKDCHNMSRYLQIGLCVKCFSKKYFKCEECKNIKPLSDQYVPGTCEKCFVDNHNVVVDFMKEEKSSPFGVETFESWKDDTSYFLCKYAIDCPVPSGDCGMCKREKLFQLIKNNGKLKKLVNEMKKYYESS